MPERDSRSGKDGQRQDGGRLALYCSLSVALMIADHHGGYADSIRTLAGYLTRPLLHLVEMPGRVGRQIGTTLAANHELAARNQELEERWLTAQADLARLSAINAENDRLRALLDSSRQLGERVLVGELIRANLDPFVHRVAINRGTTDGAYVGQPVAAAEGIVGQIESLGPFHAYVRLVTDPSHALPVTVQRNGARTIAYGGGTIDQLLLTDLPRSADIAAGDLLVTSGLGGRFPRGFPVARVTAVERNAGEGFLTVTAEPTERLDRFREVLLVWPVNAAIDLEEGPPSPESAQP